MTATTEPTSGEGDATYRELIDAAFSAIGKASFEMMRARFAGGPEATSAVAAYRDLLDAVRTHMEYLVPSARQTTSTPASSADLAAPLHASRALLAARARHSPAPADPTTESPRV